MPDAEADSKAVEVERITIDAARGVLGDLVARADYAGTTSIITRYGKDAAALVGIKEWERLRSLDAA